ncbi:hypothetical protein J4437_05955 [Candidatus Woesearchaeota archaeon]|nr:hypothetical protein [Candidatus Woesearchaeota archaeon]
MATTTIQVTEELVQVLKRRKMFEKESYEEVILDLLEDSAELSAETIRDIEKSRAEIKAGKFKTLAQVKKELEI